MFPSLDNSIYNYFDPFNLDQTTTTIQNPSSNHLHHSPLIIPYFEAFLGNGNGATSFLMNPCMFQPQGIMGSCFNFSSSNSHDNNTVASPREDSKQVDLDEHKKKKKIKENVAGGIEERVNKETAPRRRSGKTDRHSKICTANGPRDRRMRLSLQIARKFFDLQDMLGFDKASKTIEWLLSESKDSINALKENMAVSIGEDDEYEQVEHEPAEGTQKNYTKIRRKSKTTKIVDKLRKTKESRDEARKRARERTMTKRMSSRSRPAVLGVISETCSDNQETNNSSDLDKLGSFGTWDDLGSSSQETRLKIELENQDQDLHGVSNAHLLEYDQMASLRIIEKFLGLASTDSSSSSIFFEENSEESDTGFPGNWSIRASDESHQSSTGNNNVGQFRNPSQVLVSLPQNPNVSVIPVGTRSSTMIKNHSSASSSTTNHPGNNGEWNHSSSLSLFNHPSY